MLELRYDLDQQNSRNNDRYRDHRNGVVHGLLDFGLECFGLFLVGGYAVQQVFQCARLFAGIHQVAIQFIEVARALAQGGGEAVASGDILFDLVDQLAHVGVFKALTDDVEGLQQWHAGLHHGGHLSGKQGDIQRFDGFARAEQRNGLFAHLGGVDALLAQLGLDQCDILSGGFALDLGTFAVRAFPDKGTGFLRFFRHGLVLGHAVDFLEAGNALHGLEQARGA